MNIGIILIGSAIMTYLIRVTPVFLFSRLNLPPWASEFLNIMPLAALGALILPGAYLDLPGEALAVTGGLAVAGIISWFRGGLILPVLGQVGVTFLLLQYL